MDNERFVGQPHTIQVHTADDFRIGRQPTTIVTWAELDFYDLPLIRAKEQESLGHFCDAEGILPS